MEPQHHHIATTTWGPIGLSRQERERHVYIVGKSGSGKSTTLFNLAMHDIMAGEGVAVIDPHGDLAEAVADCIPPDRTHEVCYLDAADIERPVGFNPLANIPPERHALAASGIVSAFKHLWRESWGPRLEHFLFHGIMALLAAPRATLIDLPRVYTDEKFRARLSRARARSDHVRDFGQGSTRNTTSATAPKPPARFSTRPGNLPPRRHCAPFSASTRRNSTCRTRWTIGGILIANLAKGRIGEQAANLLGSLLVSHLQLVAMGRSALAPENRVPFFAHIDEFQSFGTDAFASLLSEARKFARAFLPRQPIYRPARPVRPRRGARQCRRAPRLSRLRRRRQDPRVGVRSAAAERIGRSAAVSRRGCAAASATNTWIYSRASMSRAAALSLSAARAAAISDGRNRLLSDHSGKGYAERNSAVWPERVRYAIVTA